VAEGVIDLDAADKYVMLCNVAPVATNTVYTDLTDLSTANGYTAGGNAASVSSSSQTSGTYKLVLTSPTAWTASVGSIGPFRYAVLYQNSGTKPLIGFWDYGSGVTLGVGEVFTVAFDGTNGVLQIA
jgi:hypothetical protein